MSRDVRPVAVLKRVAKSYGSVQALREVTFSVERGLTALVGPNGAGKTTALRILSTVLAADAGRVEIMGHRPAGRSLRVLRRHIGYMPQESGLYGWFSVREFLDYMATLKEIPRPARGEEVNRVIEAVTLSEVGERRIRTLSGGMRRRVLLAQALLGRPRMLILDEPTAGLDPEQRLRFVELLAEAGRRTALLLSTHQTDGLAALASKVVVIIGGSLAYDGSPIELADAARGRVWASGDRPATAVAAVRTGQGYYRCIGDPPVGAKLIRPTIDDAYLLLTQGRV